jgi:predicted CxxxxCH...CXXCH cytochrome family protein
MKKLLLTILIMVAALFIASCSKLKDELVQPQNVSVHGKGTFDKNSANFHGLLVKNSLNKLNDCSQCHAGDFSGGLTEVSCSSSECHLGIGVHVEGIVDTNSANFHGKYISNRNWDFSLCKPCHGNDYSGGIASPTCNNCHPYKGGPENCTTCHGNKNSNAPPRDLSGNYSNTSRRVGAHQVHLKGNMEGKVLLCGDCHNVPGSVSTAGHTDPDLRAEVLMSSNPLAVLKTNDPSTSEYDSNLPLFTPNPVYDLANLTCSNTYCHGYFKNGNLTNAPVWNNPATSECGSCHGNGSNPLPKTSADGGTHPNVQNCSLCHAGVIDANLKFVNASKHIDGKLNLFGKDIKY